MPFGQIAVVWPVDVSVLAALIAAIAAPGATFACTPTRIWDVVGPILCAEGPRIRLAGISARPSRRCNGRQDCADPGAEEARRRLTELVAGRSIGGAYARTKDGHMLVSGPTLTCKSVTSTAGLTTAWCVSPTYGDLSCAMLATGTVRRLKDHWTGDHC